MTDPNDNPFASPPLEHEDPADAPLMDGDKLGRWLLLPLASGTFNGAGIVSICGMSASVAMQAWAGALMDVLANPEARTILGMQMLVLAIYGGIFGGVSGILLGGIAFSLRRNLAVRSLIFLLGYLLSILFLVGPALAAFFVVGEATGPFLLVVSVFLFACSLLFAWRMNRNIRKYLLSQADGESAGST
ncbi:hypothetical protein LOC68_00445 [Blastopirellula sp. JC732]|uniref:Uncharacterized protein n=1 Tax=Blastopirellula sediminis TaxID=2894196 RepID=A0A9X1SEI7_9BACT|nr:hypothetical protein [Blastopirellula sediminis]MCC9604342.1 hypothetical protein [Blastopirellula sediminis]MCC9626862.1 hypothetical protein [Blastopirellula sediminis]